MLKSLLLPTHTHTSSKHHYSKLEGLVYQLRLQRQRLPAGVPMEIFRQILAALRGNLAVHGSYYTLRSAITRHSPASIMNQLRDDYGLHPPVHFSPSLSPFLSHFASSSSSSLPSSQSPSSTSATQTTTRTRATATWRCRCGGRAPISPRRERSQCAPGRRIRFQLRVRMCLLQFQLISPTGESSNSSENSGTSTVSFFFFSSFLLAKSPKRVSILIS